MKPVISSVQNKVLLLLLLINRFEMSYSSVDRNTKYVKLRPTNSSLYSNTTVKQLKS